MPNDEITMSPLGGWTTHTLPDRNMMLTLELVPHAAALQTGERQAVRVAMTAAQSRELAEALLRAAAATEMGQAPSVQRN